MARLLRWLLSLALLCGCSIGFCSVEAFAAEYTVPDVIDGIPFYKDGCYINFRNEGVWEHYGVEGYDEYVAKFTNFRLYNVDSMYFGTSGADFNVSISDEFDYYFSFTLRGESDGTHQDNYFMPDTFGWISYDDEGQDMIEHRYPATDIVVLRNNNTATQGWTITGKFDLVSTGTGNMTFIYADALSEGFVGANVKITPILYQVPKGTEYSDVLQAIIDELNEEQNLLQDMMEADQERYEDFKDSGTDQGSALVTDGVGQLEDKIGLLTFADGVLTDFVGVFGADPGDAVLTFPAFYWEQDGDRYLVWDKYDWDFAVLEEHFGVLVTAVRFATVAAVYGALLVYLQRVFDRIIRGASSD